MAHVKASFVSAMAQRLAKAGYTDTVDVSPEISLGDYGLMRNPRTGRVQYALPCDDRQTTFALDWTIVDLDDAKEFLADAPDDFFSFVGTSKEDYTANLDEQYLAGLIQDANMYNGYFRQSRTWQ